MLIRSARDAERAACQWMQANGHPDARLTSRGADGGVDVIADGAVAQVKAEVVPVGSPVVQQLTGIAAVQGVDGFVFALAGFTASAVHFAEQAGVALFSFDLQSEIQPVSRTARMMARMASDPSVSGDAQYFVGIAEDLGITGVEISDAPRLGLRATPMRLAAWAAEVARSSTVEAKRDAMPLADWPDLDGQLTLELGGARRHSRGQLRLFGFLDNDGERVLSVISTGDLFERDRRWQFDGHEATPTTFSKIVVGIADDVTRRVPRRSIDASGVTIRHLRVVSDPTGEDRFDPPVPDGKALVEEVRADLFDQWEHLIAEEGHSRLVVEPGRHWREARFEVHATSGMFLVFAVVPNMLDALIPGRDAVQAAMSHHLPESTDGLDCGLAKPALRDEVVAGSALVPRGHVGVALGILVEALTLDPDQLVQA